MKFTNWAGNEGRLRVHNFLFWCLTHAPNRLWPIWAFTWTPVPAPFVPGMDIVVPPPPPPPEWQNGDDEIRPANFGHF